ncbi:hypothetical protein C8A00DRAFT_12571 [Chaetomidium leptoderma]|uniref:Uncharacterized protein n=1 Tax=Chaetomidium leptoderma TaxID=669021 RepID=A0AAN7A023_9PEZI|nr:hypothetical protein C8A00DRAFT_12571 [Chaetomidium leptoderma]
MNIACHSSFDTNLRIRVSTPTGQKDLETKSSEGKPGHAQQNASVASTRITFDDYTGGFTPAVPTHTPYDMAVGPERPSTQAPTTPSVYDPGPQYFGSLQPPEAWDFGLPSPISNPSLQNPYFDVAGAQGTDPLTYSPMYFDLSTTGIPSVHLADPSFSSQAASFMSGQDQDELDQKWWFPDAAAPRS